MPRSFINSSRPLLELFLFSFYFVLPSARYVFFLQPRFFSVKNYSKNAADAVHKVMFK